MGKNFLFTSESVTEGHPDKVADQISDAILDAILKEDPLARVAVATLCNTGLIMLAGEITTKAVIDYSKTVRYTLSDIGYCDTDFGIDFKGCAVLSTFDEQSADIAQGVNQAFDDPLDQGAGDQGMMFGYASNETTTLMPYPIVIAHDLVRQQAKLRKSGNHPWLRPDGKSQVTLRYENDKPIAIDTIVLSTQHSPDIALKELREAVIEEIIKPVLPSHLMTDNIKYLVNPTGRFVIGGPKGDSGLTGRKLMVDTYGSAVQHGGGAFSGKDPSKVDRSGAYAARYVAKNIVASGLADRCSLQVSYVIGLSQPISLMVNTFGTGKVPDEKIEEIARNVFDWRPKKIIETLDLLKPIYKRIACYGHFGRQDMDLTWERLDLANKIKIHYDAKKI